MTKRSTLGVLLGCMALGALADPVDVLVTQVLDGDTVVVEGMPTRVRLASVDAPESSKGPSKPGQPFSSTAQKWLDSAVRGRSGVTMQCFDEDRWGRPVCEFWRAGLSVNTELVRAGMAWAYTQNRGRYIRNPAVVQAQQDAKSRAVGIWSQPPAIPPWDWRKSCWEDGVCAF
ncbi:thermonuclease family protein [Hydrogenophaga aromaticivorans]|uniref:thermonuclease family protein n=1 Tax=Hydrogenophaga aromaticivorans TaxID=2610898 RepID=UPI001B3992F9|nr:thermonuclease family protein [Hydrogenophaga aromaticivorans]MBQ0918331.1 thermonuclease family protein [Hydrogenophaga aromaticivorans]